MRVVYLHGFASSPQSGKAQFFRQCFLERGVAIDIPALDGGDFEHLTITSQLKVIDQAVGAAPAILMGSSLGGYLAGLYAARHPEAVERLVLLAPAFEFPVRWGERYSAQEVESWRLKGSVPIYHYGFKQERPLSYKLIEDAQQYENEPDFRQPALIFHGISDPVVSITISERFVARHPNATLKRMNAGHELTEVLEPMWDGVKSFLFQKL
jgi:uncharacterized protein